jgi:hypothetical protein
VLKKTLESIFLNRRRGYDEQDDKEVISIKEIMLKKTYP